MRVILKPAGLIFVIGVLVILSSVIFSRRKKVEIATLPEMGAISGFESKSKRGASAGKAGTTRSALYETKAAVKPIDLTEVGARDWVQWGHPGAKSVNRKSDGGSQISDLTLIKPNQGIRSEGKRGPSRGLFWSDGAPLRKSDVVYSGIFVGENNGFRFSVPAGTKERRLHVYTGGYRAGGELLAKVSDGSRAKVTQEEAALEGGFYTRAYTVTFKATSPKQKLSVEWVMRSGGGNISLQGAALE